MIELSNLSYKELQELEGQIEKLGLEYYHYISADEVLK